MLGGLGQRRGQQRTGWLTAHHRLQMDVSLSNQSYRDTGQGGHAAIHNAKELDTNEHWN